ncbi:MAG: IS1096 element passenger TnpR family protein [Phototrophicaceae bacterium]
MSFFSKDFAFTDESKALLKQLAITEDAPGSILHDFQQVLDLARATPLALTPGSLLAMASLPLINERLKYPIHHDLKRPQQKAFPAIHGLYLLLRASGLTKTEVIGKKPVLTVNEDIYPQWLALNPTERYGYLLETWLLRGNTEILGERGIMNNMEDIASFIGRYNPQNGLVVQGKYTLEQDLRYTPGIHNLGLLHLFGFVDIQTGTPLPGKGWFIEKITLTPFGTAMLACVFSEVAKDRETFFESLITPMASFGVLQRALQQYLPQWQKTIQLPAHEFRAGVYIFKVALGKIWRQIAIDGERSLDMLAWGILGSVGFDGDHLYEFSYSNPLGITETVYHPYMEETPATDELGVGDLPIEVGQTINFLFDFGDSWEFTLTLEAIMPEERLDQVEVRDSFGEAPEQYPDWYSEEDDDDIGDDEEDEAF